MPATKTRDARQLPAPSSSEMIGTTAHWVLGALREVHGLPESHSELLCRAAAGLRFIRSTASYSRLDHEVFRIALSGLDEPDAFVVEAAACCAADAFEFIDAEGWRRADSRGERRVLWFAAVLGLAEAVCDRSSGPPASVCVTCGDKVLRLEFSADAPLDARLARASSRVVALEALTGRRVLLCSSEFRPGAA